MITSSEAFVIWYHFTSSVLLNESVGEQSISPITAEPLRREQLTSFLDPFFTWWRFRTMCVTAGGSVLDWCCCCCWEAGLLTDDVVRELLLFRSDRRMTGLFFTCLCAVVVRSSSFFPPFLSLALLPAFNPSLSPMNFTTSLLFSVLLMFASSSPWATEPCNMSLNNMNKT